MDLVQMFVKPELVVSRIVFDSLMPIQGILTAGGKCIYSSIDETKTGIIVKIDFISKMRYTI